MSEPTAPTVAVYLSSGLHVGSITDVALCDGPREHFVFRCPMGTEDMGYVSRPGTMFGTMAVLVPKEVHMKVLTIETNFGWKSERSLQVRDQDIGNLKLLSQFTVISP